MTRAAIVLIVVAVTGPALPLVVWSVSHGWWFPSVLPDGFSLRAWNYVFQSDAGVFTALFTSLGIAVAVTLITMLLGVPAGRALGMHSFPGRRAAEFLLLAPIIVPGLAVFMGVHIFFIRIGLVDTALGVIIAQLLPCLPYMTVIMSGVFANYEREAEQQARCLGARSFQVFLHITLPAIMPGIVTGGLFVFLVSWSQYVLTLLVGGGRVITLPLLLFSFAQSGDHAIAAALSLVFVLPAIVVLVVTSRYISGTSPALGGMGRI